MPSFSSLLDNRRTSIKLSLKSPVLAQRGLAKLISLFRNVSQTCCRCTDITGYLALLSISSPFFFFFLSASTLVSSSFVTKEDEKTEYQVE